MNKNAFEEIREKADALGVMLSETQVFRAFRDVHKKLAASPESQALLEKHTEIFMKIHSLESEGKPVEVDDKHTLRDAQNALHNDPLLQEYARTQADIQELMNLVTESLYRHIDVGPLKKREEDDAGDK